MGCKKVASHRAGQSDEGAMIASGLIVGESLTGVALAAVSGLTGNDGVLAIGGGVPAPWNGVSGLLVFAAVCLWFGRRVLKSGPA